MMPYGEPVAWVCVCLFAVLTIAVSPGGAAGESQWERRAPIPRHVYGHASAELQGKVHFLGGCPTEDWTKPCTAHQVYDPREDSWTTAADLPLDLGWPMPAVLDGKLYLFGGGFHTPDVGLCSTDQAWVYDPETDEWSALQSMPDKRMNGCAVAVGDAIYIAMGYNRQGGYAEGGVLEEYKTTYRYDPESGSYTQVADSPETGCYIAAGAHGDRLYAVIGTYHEGGTIEERDLADGALIYDAGEDRWTKLPAARVLPRMFYLTQCSASVLHDGRVYLVGGIGPSGRTRTTSTFDIEAGQFVKGPDLPEGRCCGGGAVAGDSLVIAGGFLGHSVARVAKEAWVLPLTAAGGSETED